MIIRPAVSSGYTALPNIILKDDRLNADTRAMVALVLSKPEAWQIRPPALARELSRKGSKQVGRTRLKRMFDEAIAAGYMRRSANQTHTDGGLWGPYVYFMGMPDDVAALVEREGVAVLPHAGLPHTVQPHTANQHTYKVKKKIETIDADAGDNARARGPLISELAFQLASDVMTTLGIDREFVPPGWCGAAMWLQAGLDSGWRPEIVRIAAAKIRARKNYQPPFSFRYLLQPIIREHQLMAEPSLPMPPVVVASNQRTGHVQKADTVTDWRASRDAFRRAHAKLRAHNDRQQSPEGDGGQPSGEIIRLAAATGRDRC